MRLELMIGQLELLIESADEKAEKQIRRNFTFVRSDFFHCLFQHPRFGFSPH